MKKTLTASLTVLVVFCFMFTACSAVPAIPDVSSAASYPQIGQNDPDYDIGQLDIFNKLLAVKNTGKPDASPYALGDVTEFHTLTESGSEFILGNVLRHVKGQEGYGGVVDEYCWIIHELGTQNYTWLQCNAELLEFTSPNEISFQSGYSSIISNNIFPRKSTFVNTGARWAVFGDAVWLNAEKTPVDFGWMAFKDPDEEAKATLAKYPFFLSEIYFTPDRIGLITTGGAGNEPKPYIRIQRGDSIYQLQITLQDCSLALSSVPKPPEYCVITDCAAVQDGKDTVVTITFSGYRYYRAASGNNGGWFAGMSTEIDLK